MSHDLPLIRLRDVSRTYALGEEEEKVEALRCTSLDIQQGEFVASIGPSGSGKPTLISTLGCLDRPTGGILARARHQQGASIEAGEALLRARRIVAMKAPKVENRTNFGDNWHDWLHAQLLCREAEALLSESETLRVK